MPTKKEGSLLRALYFIKAIVDVILEKVDPKKEEYARMKDENTFEEVL